jgi:branched-chain amino acid transport system substrate-binding protein
MNMRLNSIQKLLTFPLILALASSLVSCQGGVSVKPQNDPSSDRATDTPRMSTGDRALLPDSKAPAKQQGIAAFQANNYPDAIAQFRTALQQELNDPETRIYLNNAEASLGNPYKLAVVVPIGSDLNIAREILRGVAQAQTELNQTAEFSDRKIMIVIADDGNNINVARTMAEHLSQQSDILGVIGHTVSSVTLNVAKIYDRQKLPMISPVSSAVQISNLSPYVFRTIPSDAVAARTLADYMLAKQKQQRAVVYFNSQSDYSKSLKQEFSHTVSSNGGEIVAEYDLADSNFSPTKSLEKAIQQGAQTIMLASNSDTLDRALQIVQQNRKRLTILAGDDMYTAKTLDITQEQGLGMVVAVPWHILGDPSSAFPARSRQLWGGDVNWRTVTAYDATQALAAAIQQNPTRVGIQKALLAENFLAFGASENVKFLASGDRQMAVQLVSIVPGKRSGLGYDFEPVR